jgi:lactate dehydrogenase-like 2-hydroxyacid dehydrogenase
MIDVLITYKMHSISSIHQDISYRYEPKLGISENIDYASVSLNEYKRTIYKKQIALKRTLIEFRPDILIVGSNAVSDDTIRSWREAAGNKNLSIIRRGTETGAINLESAAKHNVKVYCTPGINSPFVAKFMYNKMFLENQPVDVNSRFAIVGLGRIGTMTLRLILPQFKEIAIYSPSFSKDPNNRKTLDELGVTPFNKVYISNNLHEALRQAKYVSIAVPWRIADSYNANIIDREIVMSLKKKFILASCSNPGIFQEDSLALLNDLVFKDEAWVRIDTGINAAIMTKMKYPNINIRHDEAFADEGCQRQLDDACIAIMDRILRDQNGNQLK